MATRHHRRKETQTKTLCWLDQQRQKASLRASIWLGFPKTKKLGGDLGIFKALFGIQNVSEFFFFKPKNKQKNPLPKNDKFSITSLGLESCINSLNYIQGVSTLFLQTAWRAWYRAGSPAPQAVPPSFTEGGTAARAAGAQGARRDGVTWGTACCLWELL